MGYSKAPEQPQSSARPVCHSHAMTRTGCEPATLHIASYEVAALRTASWETHVQSLCGIILVILLVEVHACAVLSILKIEVKGYILVVIIHSNV